MNKKNELIQKLRYQMEQKAEHKPTGIKLQVKVFSFVGERTGVDFNEQIEYIKNKYDDKLQMIGCEYIEILDGNVSFKESMTFGQAFECVKKGRAMRLPTWGKDVKVKAQFPDINSKMSAPYLYVESRFGKVPWKETMIELFSEEWEVVD